MKKLLIIGVAAVALVAFVSGNAQAQSAKFAATYSDVVNKTVGSLKKLQERYRGKSQIQVYYDPARHGESVLIPGVNIFNFTPLITCSLFILAGVFAIFYEF